MILRVGSRKSRLAQAQVTTIQQLLAERDPNIRCEPCYMETAGDRIDKAALRHFGGKGLFVRDLDAALVGRSIDCAVHSLKDVPTELARGVALVGVPRRADARDVLVSRVEGQLSDLPRGARVGTVSPRRAAQALHLRRDLEIVPIRGNVETRLRKVASGEVDATFLASAGLARLGILPGVLHWTVLDPFRFVPAPGQGTLGVTVREDDESARTAFGLIESEPAFLAARCERAVARAVGGNCFLPIGVYAVVHLAQIRVVAALFSEDGRRALRRESAGAAEDAERIGTSLGREILAAGGTEIVAAANRLI